MTDTKMKAPEGTTHAEIEGNTYKIPKDRIITVTNQTHIETLKRHGFTEHFEDPKDAATKIDEMDDADELVSFIEERGGEADNTMKLGKLRRLAKATLEE